MDFDCETCNECEACGGPVCLPWKCGEAAAAEAETSGLGGHRIRAAFERAYLAGAESMRERAAAVCDGALGQARIDKGLTTRELARAVRNFVLALPLQEGEE